MEQCLERYIELSKISRAQLKFAATPSLGEKGLKDEDYDNPGEVSRIAARVLMNLLYAAGMFRFDFLQPVMSLAREVSRWTRACDKKLFRLVCATSTRRST